MPPSSARMASGSHSSFAPCGGDSVPVVSRCALRPACRVLGAPSAAQGTRKWASGHLPQGTCSGAHFILWPSAFDLLILSKGKRSQGAPHIPHMPPQCNASRVMVSLLVKDACAMPVRVAAHSRTRSHRTYRSLTGRSAVTAAPHAHPSTRGSTRRCRVSRWGPVELPDLHAAGRTM